MENKKISDGGAAFPQTWNTPFPSGMTLRDWFAGMALSHNSLCSGPGVKIAKECYYVADAMLKERENLRKASQNE